MRSFFVFLLFAPPFLFAQVDGTWHLRFSGTSEEYLLEKLLTDASCWEEFAVGICSGFLSDPAAANHHISVVEDRRLAGRDRALRFVEGDKDLVSARSSRSWPGPARGDGES